MDESTFKIDLDNPEFQQAFQLLKETTANVFLTGKAGTGKSTFLKYLCAHLRKNYVVLAPTGVAAINVGGVTLHSFFQIPLRPVPPDDPEYSIATFRKHQKISRKRSKLIEKLDLIIIDEISMVRADIIDYIDRLLRGVRNRSTVPFGGVQLLLVGDVFQLEPVATSDSRSILNRYYPNFFFFNAMAYNKVNLIAIELKKMYRQTDKDFIELLDRVRVNQMRESDLILLNSKVKDNPECDYFGHKGANESIETSSLVKRDTDVAKCKIMNSEFGIILATRKDTASRINDEKMEALEGEERVYTGLIEDEFPEKSLPTDMELTLKVGAQIMTIRNDKDRRWANGTLGHVVEMNSNEIKVELEDGKIVSIEPEVWENISYSYDEKERKVVEKVIGRFTQFPLKAAWALTIHKSQGLTFSNVTIDMGGGAFTAGQTYVALSRCRSLEGLSFINPLKRYDIIVNNAVTDFSKGFNDNQKIRSAIEEARADKLSLEARIKFLSGNFREAVEKLWEAHCLTGLLGSKIIRRFIASFGNEVRALSVALRDKDDKLIDVSKSLCRAGNKALKEKKTLKSAELFFKESLKANPDNLEAYWGLVSVEKRLGNVDNAKKYLEIIIGKKGDYYVEANILKGEYAEKSDDLNLAATCYEFAARFDKTNKKPLKKLVNLYKKAGMDDVAGYWAEWLSDIT